MIWLEKCNNMLFHIIFLTGKIKKPDPFIFLVQILLKY